MKSLLSAQHWAFRLYQIFILLENTSTAPMNLGSIFAHTGWEILQEQRAHSDFTYCMYSYVFVLMRWSLLPNALPPFQIYCAPPNLAITRTWRCRLNFAQMPIFSDWGSLTSLKYQTRDPQLQVTLGGLLFGTFSPEKSSTLTRFEPAKLGPWASNVNSRTSKPTSN